MRDKHGCVTNLGCVTNMPGFYFDTDIILPGLQTESVTLFCTSLDLQINIVGISSIISKLRDKQFLLSTDLPSYRDAIVVIDAILESDVLSKLSVFELQTIDGRLLY